MQFKHRHFMLLEALLATFIFAVSSYVLITMSTQALTYLKDQEGKRQAWEILDQQMTLIETMGLENAVSNNELQGVIDRDPLTYQWQVQIDSLDVLDVYEVTLQLTWTQSNQDQKLSLSTMMQGSSLVVEGAAQ